MKSYWILYIPAVFFFVLPLVNILYQSAKANAAAKVAEARRRAAAELKEIEKTKREEQKKKTAELKRIENENRPKRKPGRPRKNQAE